MPIGVMLRWNDEKAGDLSGIACEMDQTPFFVLWCSFFTRVLLQLVLDCAGDGRVGSGSFDISHPRTNANTGTNGTVRFLGASYVQACLQDCDGLKFRGKGAGARHFFQEN